MSRIVAWHVVGIALLATGCAGQAWHHGYNAQAPLVGAIYDVGAGVSLSEDQLVERLGGADFVLLGEKHDNVDHHRLQALVVRRLDDEAKVRAVVFEMMGTDRQEEITAHLQRSPGDAEGLGDALSWGESGWPGWRFYQPIAEAALDAGALIAGGNLPDGRVMAVATGGVRELPEALVTRTGLNRPLEASLDAAMRRELVDSHCGFAPKGYLDGMALVQRARDASMAERMAKLSGGEGATVLIAGKGHVRVDRGVPLYLETLAPGRESLSLAFVEAPEGEALPGDLPYDYVWFTPASDPPGFDPCDAYREQLEGMNSTQG